MPIAGPSVVLTVTPEPLVREACCVTARESNDLPLLFAASKTQGRPGVGVLELPCIEPTWTLGNQVIVLSTRKLDTSMFPKFPTYNSKQKSEDGPHLLLAFALSLFDWSLPQQRDFPCDGCIISLSPQNFLTSPIG
jgi:hypothetical protein